MSMTRYDDVAHISTFSYVRILNDSTKKICVYSMYSPTFIILKSIIHEMLCFAHIFSKKKVSHMVK